MRHAEFAAAAMPRSRWAETAAWLALPTLLLVVTIAHPSATRTHTWPWAFFAALYWMLAVAVGLRSFAAEQRGRWANRLVPVGLLLLITAAVLSSLASPFAAASLPRVWPTLGGVALVFALHRWLSAPETSRPRSAALGQALAVIAAVVIVFSFGLWWRGQWPLPWGTRNSVPFGHSIYTAGFVVLVMPWLAWAAWRERGVARAGWLAVLALAVLVLASTSSRGGALAFSAVAAAVAVAIVLHARWPARRKAAVAVLAILVGGTVIFADPRLRALVLERSWSDSAQESNRQRTAMLAAGWRLGEQRPWLGWGPGTVPLAYPRVRAQLDGGVDNVLELHNTPLQIWGTLGVVGAVALCVLSVGTLQAALGRLRDAPRSSEALAAAASLGGYALFALTDHQFDLPMINALAAANLAILTTNAIPTVTSSSRSGHLPLVVVLAGGMGLLAIPLLHDLRARHAYESAVVAWEHGRTIEGIDAIDRATALAPWDPYYAHQAAGAVLRAAESERNPRRRAELKRAAMQRLAASLRTGVHQEFAHFNLGWLMLELDRPAEAARHFTSAAHLVPDKGGVYFGLGLALQEVGNEPAAVRAFALEWVSDPSSMSSPAWEIPQLAGLRPVVRTEALRLYAQLRDQDASAAAAEAWARWWLGEAPDRAALARGFSAPARAFAAALPAIEGGTSSSHDAAGTQLYAAWREPDNRSAFMTVARGDAAVAEALQRRARRHPDSFHAFLTAPTEDEPALLRTYRRQRTGYGVLALHPDGPVLSDVYIVQENRVAAEFAAGLLPPKGWLPGRFLLALLPLGSEPRECE